MGNPFVQTLLVLLHLCAPVLGISKPMGCQTYGLHSEKKNPGLIQLVLTVLVFWFRALLMLGSRASSRVGERLRGNAVGGNKTESLWEENRPARPPRGPLLWLNLHYRVPLGGFRRPSRGRFSAPLPAMQKRDAQHKLLQHKGARPMHQGRLSRKRRKSRKRRRQLRQLQARSWVLD